MSLAAYSGDVAAVQRLLDQNDTTLNMRYGYDRTALSFAAYNGQEAVVRLLLQRPNVEPDVKDMGGYTPLWDAAGKGHNGVVRLLLGWSDVNPNLKDRDGRTPLWWAARKGHHGVIGLLLQRLDVEPNLAEHRVNGRTPLMIAAEYGHEAAVRQFLESDNIDLNFRNTNGLTAWMIAAERGHEAVVKLLLGRGDVNPSIIRMILDRRIPWRSRYEALSIAVHNVHHGYEIRMLLETDNISLKFREKALQLAITAGHERVVRLLREERQFLNEPNPKTDEELWVNLGCRVCWSQQVDIILLPCAHAVMCRWCADQHVPTSKEDRTKPVRSSECPLCRGAIEQKVRITSCEDSPNC
jgi:ankyrin repeat protein